MTAQDDSSTVRLTNEASIPQVIAAMTLEEKAALVGGATPFRSAAVDRLGIPALVMADGHNGINIFHLLHNYTYDAAAAAGLSPARIKAVTPRVRRKGADGLLALMNEGADHPLWRDEAGEWGPFLGALGDELRRELAPTGLPSCFPVGIAMAATWDPDRVAACGRAVAAEARAFGMDILLGPNVNIHRDGLCGRAFESFSEDPCLSAAIGVGYIRGVQDEGVAAVVKHYVANNQEFQRRGIDERISPRALREIYLPSFKAAVQEGDSWMVMSAYNKVNGTACALNRRLLTEVLRDEWSFDGFVVSDWGAVYDRVQALEAGNDLEMSGPCDPRPLVNAVQGGRLDEAVLDERVAAILRVTLKLPAFRGEARPALDRDRSAAVARQVAAEGMVLLRNEGEALPLDGGRVAVFGDNATDPIATGTGSAGVAGPHVVSVLEGLTERFGEANVVHDDLPADAAAAVVCIGVVSGEGRDRETLDLPKRDIDLIGDVARRCRARGVPCVVVLNVTGPVIMADWVERVDAVLLAWLGGMEIGRAVADVLSGDVCPSGKLPLTFPRRYKDTPTWLNFPGEFGEVIYGEGLFVGYRYYDAADVAPQYPFGFGLSYTRFELSDLAAGAETLDVDAGETLTVTVNVTNTGGRRGKEVVQLYVAPPDGPVRKPPKALKGFAKVELDANATTTVRFEITPADLAHYDAREGRWRVAPGRYRLLAGVSARDIRADAAFDARGGDLDDAE
ncbi:MAG: beta-glucosidase [Planctomycetota bacterium]